jgi:hypothetical protein
MQGINRINIVKIIIGKGEFSGATDSRRGICFLVGVSNGNILIYLIHIPISQELLPLDQLVEILYRIRYPEPGLRF